MGRIFERHAWRLPLIIVPAALLVAIAAMTVTGCGRNRETVQAATNEPIGIEPSNLFITLENRAGTPLTDLNVAIVAVTSQRFTKRLERLEDAARQDISLSDFSGADGTGFNLRFNTPKRVQVTATDLTGKKYDVSVRWQ